MGGEFLRVGAHRSGNGASERETLQSCRLRRIVLYNDLAAPPAGYKTPLVVRRHTGTKNM